MAETRDQDLREQLQVEWTAKNICPGCDRAQKIADVNIPNICLSWGQHQQLEVSRLGLCEDAMVNGVEGVKGRHSFFLPHEETNLEEQ
jgi:hypothetical protein